MVKFDKPIENGLFNRIPNRPNIDKGYFDLFFGNYNFNFQIYKKFIQISNYFIGLFENKSENDLFEKIETQFFKWLWIYGEIFVTNFDGKLQIWNVTKKEAEGIHVKKVRCRLIYDNYNYFHENKLNELEFTNLKDGYLIYWNEANNYNALLLWWDYLVEICKLEKIFLNNTIWDNKKFIYYQNNTDNDIINMEMESFTDINTPYIKNVSPISIQGKMGQAQNIITSVDTGNSKSQEAYNNLQNYVNYVFNAMGMMSQMNLKKERKTMSESQMDVYQAINIENITLRQLKRFSKFAKQMWGMDLDFGRVSDMLEQNENELFNDEGVKRVE